MHRRISSCFGWNAVCLGGCVPEFLHADITKAIIGAFYDVFHELGHGYSEKIYRRALAIVLQERGFDVIEERHIRVIFHGINIGTFYVDLVVNGKVVVEIKAARDLDPTGRGSDAELRQVRRWRNRPPR